MRGESVTDEVRWLFQTTERSGCAGMSRTSGRSDAS